MTPILHRHPRVAGLLLALALSALLLVLLEGLVRIFRPEVNFRGVDRGLFAPAGSAGGYASAPGFSGRVFGSRAAIDERGFRADATGGRRFEPARDSVIVLGDSVSFGVGVEDGKTFADRLAAAWPERNVLNAAVIGYGFEDYEMTLPRVLAAPLRVREVILGICLNDVVGSSKSEILAEVRRGSEETAGTGGSAGPVAAVNAFLRERSKLYLLVKSALRDTPELYFLADRARYDDSAVTRLALARLDRIVDILADRGIPLTVVVFPYAYQLRSNDAHVWLPQRMLFQRLAARGVPAVDLAEALRRDHAASGRPLTAYFLFDDPMHLSAAGHEVAGRALAEAHGGPSAR